MRRNGTRCAALAAALLLVGQASAQEAEKPAAARGPRYKVARVVFVDAQNASATDEATIEDSWAALREAAKKRPGLEVERLHKDTQRALAATYLQLQPLSALPGIYFLDAKDNLVTLMQGDVVMEQIAKLLAAER